MRHTVWSLVLLAALGAGVVLGCEDDGGAPGQDAAAGTDGGGAGTVDASRTDGGAAGPDATADANRDGARDGV